MHLVQGLSKISVLPLSLISALLVAIAAFPADAKYASIVVDANTGKILHQTNIDTRNYPASLTKMMTLFMVFDALNSKKWSLKKNLKVSYRAARQPASRLGLRAGQSITVEEAVLALATKSANDVAVVVAENMHKTERKFALAMTAMARKIGMKRTTFRNASGLPHRGQLSTARDMAQLARALIKRHKKFYHYFSRTKFSYNGIKHRNHNKLLTTYEGADGLKTGYIRASGFNLVASAQRQGTRLIGVIFGGNSSKHRNKLMVRFLNKGFKLTHKNNPINSRAKITAPQDSRRVVSKQSSPHPNNKSAFQHWAVQVGAYKRYNQARESAKTAIKLVPQYLGKGMIRVVPLKKKRGRKLYRSRIYGLTKHLAIAACRVLERKNRPCMKLRNKEGVQVANVELN